MKKFHKADILELSVCQDNLRAGNAHLEAEHKKLIEAMDKLFDPYIQALKEQNHNIQEYNECIQARVEDIETYIDGRSDRWKEGEQGNRYAEWRDKLDGMQIERLSVLILPDVPHEPVDIEELPLTLPDEE